MTRSVWLAVSFLSLPLVSLSCSSSSPTVPTYGRPPPASPDAGGASATDAAGAAPQDGAGASAPDGGVGPVGGYSVRGPFVYDATGQKHIFRGVARPSLEWAVFGDNLSQTDYDTMKSWGVNAVRLSLNEDFWISDPANPKADPGYPAVIDEQVQWAEADGIDVILDLHWSDGGSFTQSPGQWCMADENSVTFWTQVATKYKNDPHVLFELYNEPYVTSWDLWLNGGMTTCASYQNNNNQRMMFTSTFQAVGMQTLYDTVRATGAMNLVIVGGIGYAFDLSGVGQGHRVIGPDGQPAPNLIYNTHPYNQTGKMTPAQWYAAFGYLAATDPVIATEFGDATSATCAGNAYDSSIIPYFDATGTDSVPANPISWTAWAFYPGGCTFPSLLSDWSYGTTASGDVVKASLATYSQPR
jgi:endoglucanase